MNTSVTDIPMPRVALFGGAFDPFHNGHVASIQHILSANVADIVWVVPSGDRPDKQEISSAQARYEMTVLGVRELFGGDSRVVVSDAQSSGRVGYGTIDLVRHCRGTRVGEVFVVIGDELIADLPRWKDAEALRVEARFLVLERPGVELGPIPAGWRLSLLGQFVDGGVMVSSTEIRKRLSRGESCDGLMPRTVEAYCQQHRLYRS